MIGNEAGKILSIYTRSGYQPHIAITGNAFRGNTVPPSTTGSTAVLSMGGNAQSSYIINGNAQSSWNVNGNEFNNILSLIDMSSSGFETSGETHPLITINGTNNFFFASHNELSSSLIDSRLFDDDEGEHPEIIFEPYLTDKSTYTCPSNCTENGACVFPGLCVCEDGWSGDECNTPTCQSAEFMEVV